MQTDLYCPASLTLLPLQSIESVSQEVHTIVPWASVRREMMDKFRRGARTSYPISILDGLWKSTTGIGVSWADRMRTEVNRKRPSPSVASSLCAPVARDAVR